MKSPKVSIIIPNYNHVQYLEERIESVLNQTYQNFEIILLDDSSTDSSLEILCRYESHTKVSHFEVNKQNSGSVFKQWVKGIKLAKGEYIWIAESDDVAHIHFLEKMIAFAEPKEDVGLVFCKSKVIDKYGKETGSTLLPPKYKAELTINGEEEVSSYIIKKLSILNASSVLFKSEALRAVDYSKLSEFINVGDMFTYSIIGLTNTNYFLDEFLNFHRLHGKNTTTINSINNKIIKDRIDLIQYLIPKFETEIGRKNILNFYFRQILKSLDDSMFKINIKTLDLLLKFKYFNFRIYFKLKFLVLVYTIGRGTIPYFLRKTYKNMFKRLSFIK
jgi:glycosyltransferase involved in cell wall biosynthesis